ncbi:CrcB-like domain containing protein [Rhypophila sp. PSN 637]
MTLSTQGCAIYGVRSNYEYQKKSSPSHTMTGHSDAPVKGHPRPNGLSDEHDAPETNRRFEDGVSQPPQHPDRARSLNSGPQDAAAYHGYPTGVTGQVQRPPSAPEDYDAPDSYVNLDEVVDVSPIQNPDEEHIHRYESLEVVRAREQEQRRRPSVGPIEEQPEAEKEQKRKASVSKLATQLYTVSYLILFSILGTLARLGLQALVGDYPRAPVIFPSLWPNFAGCLVMGFLAEDVRLFRHELDIGCSTSTRTGTNPTAAATKRNDDTMRNTNAEPTIEPASPSSETTISGDQKKSHAAIKKTIPLYIGLATGFCGSFTSFSSFMRDVFLALSNDLTDPSAPRNGGYSLSAVLAVILVTISLSLSGLFIGAHIAIALHPVLPSLPFRFTRNILDRFAVILGFGAWLGAVFLCIFPPDRDSASSEETESWRGAVTFALVFAPLGCLLRFYLSLRLNSRVAGYPLGTFAANVLGTTVLGVAWAVAHIPVDGVSCEVLQGIEDGFCGCLTTVSTWVSELAVLRRRNAYVYGGTSVGVGLAMLVAIMGGMRWGANDGMGFKELACVHSFG